MNTSKNKKVAQVLIKLIVILIVTFALISPVEAEIIIQGHSIGPFGWGALNPSRMDIDQFGAVYVGNRDNTWPGVYLSRINPSGGPAVPFPNSRIYDPDAVAVDRTGALTGLPGTILVGQVDNVVKIDPNTKETNPLFSMDGINPDNMVVTNDGNLIMAEAGVSTGPNPFIHKVTMFDGRDLSVIYATLEQEIAFVTSDPTTGGNIFVGDGGIVVFDPNGIPMPSSPMNCDFDSHVGTIAYVRNSPSFSDGLYAKVGTDLVYIDILGNKKIIGSGLESIRDFAFAPDGQLYLITASGNVLRTCATCIADFNCDGDVDGSDLAVFKEDFGRTDCSVDCEGDFDIDGDVDGSDLAIFAAYFGRTDCSLQEL